LRGEKGERMRRDQEWREGCEEVEWKGRRS
jgi:hypothetical protein